MVDLERVKRGLSSPSLLARKLNILYHTGLQNHEYNVSGTDIFAEDWDNLLILDACRHDLFEERTRIGGESQTRVSRGSSTTEFLAGNFGGRKLHDVVYVTANPQYHRYREKIESEPHAVIDVWKEDGWDDAKGTVLPETTTEYAIEAAERYDNKRLVVHYIQPHYPFLTDETMFDKGQLENPEDDDSFWRQIFEGRLDIDSNQLWELYRDNLDRVLASVEDFLEAVDGRTVVTSDHGNMHGERSSPIPIREWGHPRGVHTRQLVRVPWLVVEGRRREIVPEPPVASTSPDTSKSVDERLRSLGYT